VSSAREHRAVVIETTARTVAVVEPKQGQGDHLSCANRYRHADTQPGQLAGSSAWDAHSSGRQGRLEALVAARRDGGGMTTIELQHALGDHVDPSAPDRGRGCGAIVHQACTVKSIVVEPEDQAIHISVGPAPTGRGPYARVGWQWDGDVGGTEVLEVQRPTLTTDAERAFEIFTEATRLDRQFDDWRAALARLEEAISLQPDDPSYRFLAGVLTLRTPNRAAALTHFERGLESETVPLRRGQLLLWGSRAADGADQPRRAAEMRAELIAMDHDSLVRHRALARLEERKPYDLAKRRIEINLLLSDAH
jgi:hypothetical protein